MTKNLSVEIHQSADICTMVIRGIKMPTKKLAKLWSEHCPKLSEQYGESNVTAFVSSNTEEEVIACNIYNAGENSVAIAAEFSSLIKAQS